MPQILIVDDHPLVASATAREVASIVPGAATYCVKTIAAAEAAITSGTRPDFILLDLMLPDAEGLSGLVRLRQAAPDAVIALVTGETSHQVMRDAFAMGARGYLVKTNDVEAFLEGLRKLFNRGFYFPPEAAESPQSVRRPGPLTAREVSALRALATGKANKQLAVSLGVSESTFKSHLRAIYKKLGVRTRVGAVGRARELGLLEFGRRA